MSTTQKTVPWSALIRRTPEDTTADVMAFLSAVAALPQPAVAALLAHPVRLSALGLTRNAPVRAPRKVDLLLVLSTPAQGHVRMVLSGPLARGLLALLQDDDPLPIAPLSAGEAGLLTGLVATALSELAPPGLQLTDVHLPDPAAAATEATAAALMAPTPPPVLTASAQLQVGPVEGPLHVELDEAATSELEQAAQRWRVEHDKGAERRNGDRDRDLGGGRDRDRYRPKPVQAELVLARAALPWHQVTRAEPGDAIVFPGQPPFANDCAAWLRIGSYEIPAHLCRTDTGREIVLEGDPRQTAEPDPWQPNRETIAPAQPVQLRVILADVELTTNAVAELRQGSAITLDAPLGATAELRCGHRTVGRGELLEVNDCLGLRLTEILV